VIAPGMIGTRLRSQFDEATLATRQAEMPLGGSASRRR